VSKCPHISSHLSPKPKKLYPYPKCFNDPFKLAMRSRLVPYITLPFSVSVAKFSSKAHLDEHLLNLVYISTETQTPSPECRFDFIVSLLKMLPRFSTIPCDRD
jgi:hypothetical protein